MPRTSISPARQSMSTSSQRGDLAGAQPQPRQQGEDREISAPDSRAPIAARQQPRDRPGVQRLDQSRQPPARDRRNRVRQRVLDLALHMQEPQQHPQPGDHALRRCRRTSARASLQHERADGRARPAAPARARPPSPLARQGTRARRQHSCARSTAPGHAASRRYAEYRSTSCLSGRQRHRSVTARRHDAQRRADTRAAATSPATRAAASDPTHAAAP